MATEDRDHTIILVHGIRTHAFWYERFRRLFDEERRFRIEGIKYGRFDFVRFMVPGPWRRGPIEKVASKIRPLVVEANRRGDRITVIAHSNGTQIVTRILKEDVTFEIDDLILCGSIVDDDYEWRLVKHRVRGRIVNEFGVRDPWPAVARSFTWGYGYSGTVGFGSPVKDRIHNATHSDYFTETFMRTYWMPLIKRGEWVPSPLPAGERVGRPWWFELLELPWRWVVLVAVVAGSAAAIWAVVAPTPAPPRPPTLRGATFKPVSASVLESDGNWAAFDLYNGKPRNVFEDTNLRTVGRMENADGAVSSSGQPERSVLEAALSPFGVPSSRKALHQCVSSASALSRCPSNMQAAVLSMVDVGNFATGVYLNGLDDSLSLLRDRLPAMRTTPAVAGADVRRLHIVIANTSNENRNIVAVRFRLRAVFHAEGDGAVLDQPLEMVEASAGTLVAKRLFLVNCRRPDVAPNVELILPKPLNFYAGGQAQLTLTAKLGSNHAPDDNSIVVDGPEAEKPQDAEMAEFAKPNVRCKELRDQRAQALAENPAFQQGLLQMRSRMFESYQNSAVEVAVRDDRGVWTKLGTMNFSLP